MSQHTSPLDDRISENSYSFDSQSFVANEGDNQPLIQMSPERSPSPDSTTLPTPLPRHRTSPTQQLEDLAEQTNPNLNLQLALAQQGHPLKLGPALVPIEMPYNHIDRDIYLLLWVVPSVIAALLIYLIQPFVMGCRHDPYGWAYFFPYPFIGFRIWRAFWYFGCVKPLWILIIYSACLFVREGHSRIEYQHVLDNVTNLNQTAVPVQLLPSWLPANRTSDEFRVHELSRCRWSVNILFAMHGLAFVAAYCTWTGARRAGHNFLNPLVQWASQFRPKPQLVRLPRRRRRRASRED